VGRSEFLKTEKNVFFVFLTTSKESFKISDKRELANGLKALWKIKNH
jgi:hypothetical protein